MEDYDKVRIELTKDYDKVRIKWKKRIRQEVKEDL